MNTFSNIVFLLTLVVGVTIIIPQSDLAPEEEEYQEESVDVEETDSPFVKKAKSELKVEYASNLRACDKQDKACRHEWREKLTILNEEGQ